MKLVLIIIATVFILDILFIAACIKMAGDCTRQEERGRRLQPCPRCRRHPLLGYCCGEYFIAGADPDCPCCGTAFTEMHSSPQLEINAWNRRVKGWVD